MTDEETKKTPNASKNATEPAFQILGQYIRDLSFEAPNSPDIFQSLVEKHPEAKISIDIDVRSDKQSDAFEVSLIFNVEIKAENKVAFLLELTYCGVFLVRVPEEHQEPLLRIEAPRLLFPFARNLICDISRDGGFTPLMLQPVDFAAMYRNHLEQAAAQQQPKQN